jgi:hypothetical protein
VTRFTWFSVNFASFGTVPYDQMEDQAVDEAAFCQSEFDNHYIAVDAAFV